MRSVAYFLAPMLVFVLTLAPIASTQQQLPIPNTPGSGQGESRPSPDPTRLTTEQLIREINSVREIFAGPIEAIKKEQEATNVRLDKISDLIEKRVLALQALHEERFASIVLQFKERDTRAEQTNLSNKIATEFAFQAAEKGVSTAFQSAREAAAKSEAGFSKQIEQLANLFDASFKALNSKLDDLKTRVGALEGLAVGSRDLRETSQASIGNVLGIVGAIIALLSLIGMVLFNLLKSK